MTSGNNRRSILLALEISIASFCYGYNLSNVNAPKSIFTGCSGNNCFPMTEDDWALMVSIFAVGGFVGTLACPPATNVFGRRMTLLYNNIFLISGYVLMGVAQSPTELIVGRFLLGIGSVSTIAFLAFFISVKGCVQCYLLAISTGNCQ